jgi:hypothetical protein
MMCFNSRPRRSGRKAPDDGLGSCTQLLFCIKNLERVGDHATNIAEQVYFIVTGAPHPGRATGDRQALLQPLVSGQAKLALGRVVHHEDHTFM